MWYIWDMLKICMTFFWKFHVIYRIYASIFLRFTWDRPELCLLYTWYMRDIWDMFEIYLKYVSFKYDWYIPEMWLIYVRDMYEMCLRFSRYTIQNLDKVSVSDWVTEWVCDVMKARDAYASKNIKWLFYLSIRTAHK